MSARATAVVRAKVGGELTSVRFKEGDEVRAGQVLAEIDARSYQAALSQALGTLQRDQALLKNAQLDLKRYQDLLARDSIASQQVDTQAALVRQLDLGRVHLFGHSRGGGVALAVARQAPELLRTLILAEPSGLVEVSTDPAATRQRLEGGNALAQRLREVWQAGTAREVMAARAWEAANGPGSWDRMPAPTRQMISDNIVTLTAPMTSAGPPIATCEQVGALRMPVLLLQSSRADKLYIDSHDGLRRCNAAIGPAVVVPESSHNMHLSNPAFFNQAVLDFVRAD